jgi:hypothetical protein
MRNPGAHELFAERDLQQAPEYLGFMSLLYRRIDGADIVPGDWQCHPSLSMSLSHSAANDGRELPDLPRMARISTRHPVRGLCA